MPPLLMINSSRCEIKPETNGSHRAMFTGYLIDLCHGYYSLPWYHYLTDPKKKLEVVENDQTPHIKRENTATKIKTNNSSISFQELDIIIYFCFSRQDMNGARMHVGTCLIEELRTIWKFSCFIFIFPFYEF